MTDGLLRSPACPRAPVAASRPSPPGPASRRIATLLAITLTLFGGAPVLAGLPAPPRELWRWHGPTDLPDYPRPVTTTLVASLTDDDGDGRVDRHDVPEVIFVSESADERSRALTVLDGATGELRFLVAEDWVSRLVPAVGDVDGDGLPELVMMAGATVTILENDGTRGPTVPLPEGPAGLGQSVGLADLDEDGVVEVHSLGVVQSLGGALSWSVELVGSGFSGNWTQVADLDPVSPGLELLSGAALFSSRGAELWRLPGLERGASGVGDLDGDGDPEIVTWFFDRDRMRTELRVLDHEGAVLWGPLFGTADWLSTNPLVVELDGDAGSEVVVEHELSVEAFDWSGGELVSLWRTPIVRAGCCTTPTAFDFDGDGLHEIVFNDDSRFYVFDPVTGAILFEDSLVSLTRVEAAVIADVDADGDADIVLNGVDTATGSEEDPVDVVVAYEVPGSCAARRIWNQEAYHVGHVTEGAAIPVRQETAWTTHRTWQAQVLVDGPRIEPGRVLVTDPEACASGLDVSWTAATWSDPVAGGVYHVYRSAPGDPSCTDATSREPVARGLTATSWHDPDPPPGPVRYVVEAEDLTPAPRCVPAGAAGVGAFARACAPEPVEDQVGFEPPAGVFATLRASHRGQEVTMHWHGARALAPDEHFHLLKTWRHPLEEWIHVNGEDDRSREHLETDTSARRQFFDLRVANGCEQLSADEYPATFPVAP